MLLNFFWFFTGQQIFRSHEKVVILEIYNEFLTDFREASNKDKESQINFGDFIDSLKIDLNKHWEIVFSPNKQLRIAAFKVLKQSYYLGLISHLQASEVFLIYLNDDVTDIDVISGKKL